MVEENPLIPKQNNDFPLPEILEELAPPLLLFGDFPENPNPSGFKNPPLTKQERIIRAVTYLHSSYTFNVFDSTSHYPPVGDLLRRVGCSQEELNEIIPNINASLVKRGYDPYIYEVGVHSTPLGPLDLDPFFVIAVDLICDITDKRSKSVKLKQAEISTARFNNLMKDKKHYDFWKKRWDETYKLVRDFAQVGLAKNVEAADLQSIKFFLELENYYRPETAISNLGVVIAQLMEILVQFLSASQLAQVAEKFEGVINASSKELVSGSN